MSEKKQHSVLIVEDEALVARELKIRLAQMGYDVVGTAYGRSDGISLAREAQPDLLLTDIHLKNGEDGIEMANVIRQERDVPVVFLTAYSDEETVLRAKAATPYGYIIKPVENRELQITIDIALYKFSIEKELRDTQQLLQTALTCIGSGLVFVDESGCISDLNEDAETILSITRDDSVGRPWRDVLAAGSSVHNRIDTALSSNEVTKLAPFIADSPVQNQKLVDGIVGPMEKGGVLILRELTEISDSIEVLPSADDLLSRIGSDRLAPSESSMCQLLIAPQLEGDVELIEDVSKMLNQLLRSTDLVSVYSNSQLSVSMPYTSVVEGESIADSILSVLNDQHSEPGFSIGLSFSSPGDQQPFELFRRASWALKVAQDSGGSRVITWNDELENRPIIGSESEKRREYHNLVLLWNVLNVVARTADLVEVSKKVCSHLLHSFDLEEAAVLSKHGDGIVALSGAVSGTKEFSGIADLSLSGEQFGKVREALSSELGYSSIDLIHLYDLGSERLLYLKTRSVLTTGEFEFLKTLVSYFAAGLARFELPSSTDADHVVEGTMIFRSAIMASIYESIQLVAPTDATVLVVGESGTGKELIARRIHEKSSRKDKPFVVVDCGAVVGSLIESELFGHEKGAFTGADSKFPGRLREAHGGTVLLDEIGDLPLDVQAKLLRFVQDREIAAVGSASYERVDTRVIAATNHDLSALVADGNFREDLYYRLNVFAIDAPPLRDRKEDVLLLANHYLRIYAEKYNKKIIGFTDDAEQALLEHVWPGNIRELINVINRGLILSKDSRLSTIHLGLFPADPTLVNDSDLKDLQPSLESLLRDLVDICLMDNQDLPPLGKWLEENLIEKCLAVNSGILNRAAKDLGMPESTLRRKVARIRSTGNEAVLNIPADLRFPSLEEFIKQAGEQDQTVLDFASHALVGELERRKLNRKDASSLLGVSLPTYRRMLSSSTRNML